MTLGRRINDALIRMLLRQEGDTAHPLLDHWARRVSRLAEDAEIAAGLRPPRREAAGDIRARLRRVMSDYEGYDPVAVAYYEGASVEAVRDTRRALRRHMKTGYLLEGKERALTARASDTPEYTAATPETPVVTYPVERIVKGDWPDTSKENES